MKWFYSDCEWTPMNANISRERTQRREHKGFNAKAQGRKEIINHGWTRIDTDGKKRDKGQQDY
jgi:hypothetical protein